MTYFKNQKDLAHALVNSIDCYWNHEMREQEFIEYLRQVVQKNNEKIYKENKFTGIIPQRHGKKRLDLLRRLLT